MLMQHIGVGYFGYYRATAYAMKHSLMPEIAKLRMKALNFWDKHGIRAAADAFDVSTRTLYWWRRLLRTGGPEALIPRSKAPLVRRSRHWHPDVLKEIRRLRTELPNLGKEQIFVRLKPWCEARHFTCPSTSTIGRIIAGAHDKMRMIPVRLSARGKARLIKKRSVKPRRPKQYRPVKTGELIGMDAIELRMGDLRRYIITMIDEHSDYALALAVPSLNSDITSHFFSKATKLFPVAIRQVVTDNGKEFLGNFDKTLQEASIKHIWTYPYTPKMNATCERFNRTLREQFIEFNELLLFEDLNLFNQRMAEYLVLYNSKRPHKSLELMTPVDYILRESKNCNMWWTHTQVVQRLNPDAILLGEVDVAVEDYRHYFGQGDRLQMVLNFWLNKYLYLSLAQQRAAPVVKALQAMVTPPDGCCFVNWLRNHDELDLEGIGERNKRQVIRTFAPDKSMSVYQRGVRRRLAPMLDGDTRRIALAHAILLALPGVPVMRYGDEIGMGDDLSLPERYAVRTPMQWSAAANAGFSRAARDDLPVKPVASGRFRYQRINVETALRHPRSLLHRVRNMVLARTEYTEPGSLPFTLLTLKPDAVLGLLYRSESREVLMLANCSQQAVEVLLPPLAEGYWSPILEDKLYQDGLHGGKDARLALSGYGYRWFSRSLS
ncbi:IS481 family transposase [Klebsiella pneumoniae]